MPLRQPHPAEGIVRADVTGIVEGVIDAGADYGIFEVSSEGIDDEAISKLSDMLNMRFKTHDVTAVRSVQHPGNISVRLVRIANTG